jgi:hypothetical protein
MKTLCALCTLFVLSVPRAAESAPDPVQAVKAAFDGYRAALKEGDGVTAARIVDSQTLKYYGTMKQMALTAPAAKVKQQSFLDRLMIVILRLRVELDRLRAMSSKQLFAHGVEQGWISKNSVANVQLGAVSVTKNTAVAQALRQGKPIPLSFSFHKEGGRWRFDLQALMQQVNASMVQLAKQRKLGENELILLMASQATKKPVPKDIWDPPKKK